MFGPSIPLLHNGRWTIYAQRTSSGVRLTLVGEDPDIVEESTDGTFKNTDHPFSAKQIESELKGLPGPAPAQAAEVIQ